jgi:hypothetical protein
MGSATGGVQALRQAGFGAADRFSPAGWFGMPARVCISLRMDGQTSPHDDRAAGDMMKWRRFAERKRKNSTVPFSDGAGGKRERAILSYPAMPSHRSWCSLSWPDIVTRLLF